MTVNNWLRFFRSIMNEAVEELGLEKNPVMKVKGLDTSTCATYTEEEPNALAPEEVQPFLAAMRTGIRNTSRWWRSGLRPGGGPR